MAVARASGGARLDMRYLQEGLRLPSRPTAPGVNHAARRGTPPLMRGGAAAGLVRLAVADHGAVGGAAAHGGHEEQRDQQTDDADDHQDQPDGRDLEARDVRVDGEVEDRADRDQEEGGSDAHGVIVSPAVRTQTLTR